MQELQPTPPKKSSSKGLIIVISLVAVVFLAVPCVGVLAAVAIPAFISYQQRAKSAEAEANLLALFTSAAGYYQQEQWDSTANAPSLGGGTACTVGTARTPNVPGSGATVLPSSLGPSFDALGFAIADPVRYQYEIIGTGGCGHGPNENLYSFRAYGDLDGDGVTSLFEISASSDAQNDLIRSPAIYRENELE